MEHSPRTDRRDSLHPDLQTYPSLIQSLHTSDPTVEVPPGIAESAGRHLQRDSRSRCSQLRIVLHAEPQRIIDHNKSREESPTLPTHHQSIIAETLCAPSNVLFRFVPISLHKEHPTSPFHHSCHSRSVDPHHFVPLQTF
ncbi:hypothetical protein BLNAU_2819 [Blattamonas nauphoetae]|uniref:Uncharacterized protein n=1 Tax=Blattamonas nauphoetae TaxID=2049346 RepID=A0ABQ9YEG5_9EUKA|nr:hypothetical protein BLNAU_2819 [Blattamonas nauphoetae]